MAIKQLSIFVENKKGAIVNVTDTLAENNVDLRALSIADTQDFGIMRAIVDDLENAKTALQKASIVYSVTDVVAVAVNDIPGGLSTALKILADGYIDIEYLYAFVSGSDNQAYVALRVIETEEAEKLLASHGIQVLSKDNIKHI